MNAQALHAKLRELYQPFAELGSDIDLKLARSLLKEADLNCRVAEDCGVSASCVKQQLAPEMFEPILEDIVSVGPLLPLILNHLPWMRAKCSIPYRQTDEQANAYRHVLDSYRANLFSGSDFSAFMDKLDAYFLDHRHELYLQEYMKVMYILGDEVIDSEVIHSLRRTSHILADACASLPKTLLAEDAATAFFRTIKSAYNKTGNGISLKHEVLEKLRADQLLGEFHKVIDYVLIQAFDEQSIYDFYRAIELSPSAGYWKKAIDAAPQNMNRNAVIIAAVALYINGHSDMDISDICDKIVKHGKIVNNVETAIIGDLIKDHAVSTNERFKAFVVSYIDSWQKVGMLHRAFEHFDEMGIDRKQLRFQGASRHLAGQEFGI